MHTISLYDQPAADGTPVVHAFQFAAGWDEARPEDLLAIAEAQLSTEDATRMKFNLLRALADIPAALMERMPAAADLTFPVDTTDRSGPFRPVETMAHKLLPQLDWCFTSPSYTRSLLPELAHAGITWTGPDSLFERMTLHQWCFCTELVQAFRRSSTVEEAAQNLANAMGALYQPAHCSWRKEPIEEYAAKLATLAPGVQLAAVLNYEALHSTLSTTYPRVFKPNMEGDPPSPQGLFGLAHDAAKSGAFVNYGDEELVENKRLHLVLGYMEHTLFHDEQEAARAKRRSTNTRETQLL